MPKYRVLVPELWLQPVIIEADTPVDAKEMVIRGEGVADEEKFEFAGVLTDDHHRWEVSLEEEKNEDAD